MIVTLTPEQQKNLMVFLNRVETKGLNEAAALVDVARLISNAPAKQEQDDGK